jgi:hypothetical protein
MSHSRELASSSGQHAGLPVLGLAARRGAGAGGPDEAAQPPRMSDPISHALRI